MPIPNSSGGYIYTGVGKISDFRRKSPFIPETVRDRQNQNIIHSFRETDYSYAYTFL